MATRPTYRMKRPSKAQRRAALAAYLDGLPDPPELPEEIDTVVIHQDGRLLTGDRWIKPQDFIDDDIEHGRLVALKGDTPAELPGLDDQASGTDHAKPPTRGMG